MLPSQKNIIWLFGLLSLVTVDVFSNDKSIESKKKEIIELATPEKLMHSYYELARLYVPTNFDSAVVYYNKSLFLAQKEKDKKFSSKVYLGLSKIQAKKSELKKARNYCAQALHLANEIDNDSLIILSNLLTAKLEVMQSNFTNVLSILDPTMEKAEMLKDSLLISECYDAYGAYYYYSNVSKSIEYYIKSLRIIEKYKESESLLSRVINVGSLYGRIDQNEKAIEYLLRAVKIAERTKQEYVKSTIFNNLAAIYFDMGDTDKSKYYLEEALTVATQLKDDPMVCGIIVNLGELCQKKQQYKKAMQHYEQGLENPSIENLPEQKIYTLHNIASLYYDLGEYHKAINFAKRALKIALDSDVAIHNAALYKVLAESYEKIDDYKAALVNQKLYKIYNDSLFNIKNTAKITEIQSKYDFDTAEKENMLLKKDIKIQALTINKQQDQQLLLLIVIFLVLLSIIVVYLRMKKDRKMNILLSNKNEEIKLKSQELEKANIAKDKFFTILAHDLRNPFNSILGSLEILNGEYDELSDEDRKQFIDLINKSAISTNKLLTNLLEWSMLQRGRISMDKKNNNLSSLVQESVTLHQNLALRKEIAIQNEIQEQLIAFFDKKSISITINNLINNAIKFTSHKGKIIISARKDEGQVSVAVTDTGVGMPPEKLKSLFNIEGAQSTPGTNSEPGSGLGLILCKEFTEKNDGQIKVVSEEGKGSCFEITLPVKERV